MREVKMTALIGRSFDWTRTVLFRPFSVKKWLALILIAWLAGALSSGNGGGNGGGRGAGSSPQQAGQTAVQPQAEVETPPPAPQKAAPVSPEDVLKSAAAFVKTPVGAATVAAVLAFGLLFILFWTWLSCRFKFIWFDAVMRNSGAISEPYRRFKDQANSLFKAKIVLGFLGLAFFGGIAAAIAVPNFIAARDKARQSQT